jgi:hypothetical protein
LFVVKDGGGGAMAWMKKSPIWDAKNGSSGEEPASGGDGIVGEWRGGIIRNSRERGRGRLTRNFGDRRE